MVIDILHSIYQLGLSKRSNKVLVDVKADDLHLKTSCITCKMESYNCISNIYYKHEPIKHCWYYSFEYK